jgi:hypothetical protein
MKTGTKNVVEIKKGVESIEKLTNLFKSKRISYEEFVEGINISLSNMTNKRDYIEYLTNIGYFEKFVK